MTTTDTLSAPPAPVGRPPARPFEDVLADLDSFIAEHGHANPVRQTTTEDGFRLGHWVARQRTKRTKGTLTLDQHDALASRGVLFPSPPDGISLLKQAKVQYGENAFAAQVARVDAFIAEHGHARIPLDHVTRDGIRLGEWIGTTRNRRNRGVLPEDRIAALDERGIEWTPKAGRKDYDAVFTARLICLDAFIAEHGHASPTKTYRCTHPECKFDDLGQWVLRARKKYRGAIVGPLTAKQVDALEQRGFEWSPKRGAAARRA